MRFPPRPAHIHISVDQMDRMLQHVIGQQYEEACGLLSGIFVADTCKVMQVFPMKNALNSPIRFLMDPKEQLERFDQIENDGLDLVGIYHSHLYGPVGPSQTDIAEAYYPEVVYLVWSRIEEAWQCNAYTIQGKSVASVDLIIQQTQ